MCGWLKDRWGLSWQITPQRLLELMADSDHGRAKRAMEAMMKMRKIDIATVEARRRTAAGAVVRACRQSGRWVGATPPRPERGGHPR